MSSPKIVIVTGANSGLGYEVVKALLESDHPYHVYAAARSAEKSSSTVEALRKDVPGSSSTVEPLEIDLTSDESIEKVVEQLKSSHGHVDVLVNNAGATFDLEYLAGRVSLRECFNNAYDVNVAGTHVLTHSLAPLLLQAPDPRLLFVSGLSQITRAAEKYFPTPDLPAGWPKDIAFETIGYRSSKCALNMLMLDWSHKLKADGVKVWAIGPGMMVTNLGGVPELAKKMGSLHPSISGNFVRTVVEGARDGETGKLITKGGVAPW